jgi:hypothetical protein
VRTLLRVFVAATTAVVLLCSPLLAGPATASVWVETRADGIYLCSSSGCTQVLGWNAAPR